MLTTLPTHLAFAVDSFVCGVVHLAIAESWTANFARISFYSHGAGHRAVCRQTS